MVFKYETSLRFWKSKGWINEIGWLQNKLIDEKKFRQKLDKFYCIGVLNKLEKKIY